MMSLRRATRRLRHRVFGSPCYGCGQNWPGLVPSVPGGGCVDTIPMHPPPWQSAHTARVICPRCTARGLGCEAWAALGLPMHGCPRSLIGRTRFDGTEPVWW